MSNFKTLVGNVGESESDIYARNIPTSAKDLDVKEVPLDMRLDILDKLEKLGSKLKEMQIAIVINPKEKSKYLKIKNSLDIELGKLINIIDRSNAKVNCIIATCSKQIPIYKNICDRCLNVQIGMSYKLMMIRNIETRVGFLKEYISASLSNHTEKEELINLTKEAFNLSKFL